MRVALLLVFMLLPSLVWAEMLGEKLFNRKCTMCHLVKGRGGAIGPDLSKVASRMSAEQLQSKVAYPKKFQPGSSMPSFATLEASEMQALLAYLKTLK